MRAYFSVGLLAFAASALGASLPACLDPGGDCDCQPTPAEPSAQSLPLAGVSSYDAVGNSAEAPINPVDGTIEVTGPQVLISYQEGGASYQVVYDVVPDNR